MKHMRSLNAIASTVALMLALAVATAMAQTNAVPFVNQPLVPASTAPGSAAFTLTVNGTGFVSGSVVNWKGSARTTTFVSSSSLQAAISASDVASKGTATITVTSPAPGGGISNRVFFPVREPLASVAGAVDNNFHGVSNAATAVAGDFNNDGKQDVVVGLSNGGNGTGVLYFYSGGGNGSFGTPKLTASNIPIAFMMTGDFNNDGNLDVLVGDDGYNFASQAAVFLGDGHGNFTEQALFGQGTGDFGGPVALGDFNGDGKLDVLYDCDTGGVSTLWVLLGNGDGTFQGPKIAMSVQNVIGGVAVGDFNGDGKLDVATGNAAGQPLQIFLGNGDGTFTAGASYSVSYDNIAAADLNGDGKLDLVFDGTVGVCSMLGNGDGTFASPTCGTNPNGGVMQLADFNGDGKLDVAAQGFVYLGNGDGTFQSGISLPFAESFGDNAFNVADFNNDGELDFVFPFSTATPTVLLQTTLSISTANLIFPNTAVGNTSKPQPVVLTNIGTTRLNVSGITLTGTDPGDFVEQGQCAGGIKAGGSCTVKVAFKPTADGTRTASLSVAYNGVGNPQAVPLKGTGTH